MRITVALLAVSFPILLGIGPPLHVAEPEPDERPVHPELQESMVGISDELHEIKEIMRSPTAPLSDAFQHIETLQRLVIDAKSMTPIRVARLEEPEREIERRAYQFLQAELLAEVVSLELALLNDDLDAAWNVIDSSLSVFPEIGHTRFIDP